jgi:hypothetical protein
MKKLLICNVVALAILLAGGTAMAKETGKNKETNTKSKSVGQKKHLSARSKQWREQLKAMTPEQRRLALAQRAFDAEIAPWQQVRKIAATEKANKTVAAIDKILAGKQEQFKKRLAAIKGKKPARTNRLKAEGTHRQTRKAERKKKDQTQG